MKFLSEEYLSGQYASLKIDEAFFRKIGCNPGIRGIEVSRSVYLQAVRNYLGPQAEKDLKNQIFSKTYISQKLNWAYTFEGFPAVFANMTREKSFAIARFLNPHAMEFDIQGELVGADDQHYSGKNVDSAVVYSMLGLQLCFEKWIYIQGDTKPYRPVDIDKEDLLPEYQAAKHLIRNLPFKEVKNALSEWLDSAIGNKKDLDLVKRYMKSPEELIKVAKAMAKSEAQAAAKASKAIGTYISLCDQTIKDYIEEYESLSVNKERIEELDVKINGHRKELDAADQIPKEYLLIVDPKGRKEELENSVKKERGKRDTAHEKLLGARAVIKAEEEADDYLSIDELKEAVVDNETLLNQNKEEFKAWKQIKEAAENILNSVDANPLQQFEDDFRKYLTVLTADGVTLSSLGEKMKADIYSGDNRMTFVLLSEGTKDTIALAFRLAVIKFLFPDGGGFAVFDDPFTDMDAERRTRACKLLKEFAVDNQIVFATCDRSYFDVMGGNLIDFTNMQ